MFRYFFITALLALLTVSGSGCSSGDSDQSQTDDPYGPVDPEVQRIVENINEGSTKDQLKAIQEAAQLGEKAWHATESLCAGAVSENKEVSRAALLALQKVHPALYSHVRTIATDESTGTRSHAVSAIGQMGREGRGALPAILHELNRKTNVSECLEALGNIAPDSDRVVDLLASYLIQSPPRGENAYEREHEARQAAEALGQIGHAEPAKRAKVVAILKPHLSGFSKLYAVRAVALCGPEAASVAEEIGELQFDSNNDVRQAADRASKEIEGFTKAAAKLNALGPSPSLEDLAKCAADPEDHWLRQLAGERFRKFHPEVERLAAALFTPADSDYKQAQAIINASFKPANEQAGPPAVALVAYCVKHSKPTAPFQPDYRGQRLLAAYQALARISPDSPAVVDALIEVCNHHVSEYTRPRSLREEDKLPNYWTGAELVTIAGDQPKIQKMLCDAATRLATTDQSYRDFASLNTRLLNQVLGNLTVLATEQPGSRPGVAEALTIAMKDRASKSTVDLDQLEQALLACGEETYKAVAKTNFSEAPFTYGWDKRLLEIMRKTKPANDPVTSNMEFKPGDQVWTKSGQQIYNATVVEVLAGAYRVHQPGRDPQEYSYWLRADDVVKPRFPVPKEGFREGDRVEVEYEGRWTPATMVEPVDGHYVARLVETNRRVTPYADQLRHPTKPFGPGDGYRVGDKVRVVRGGETYDAQVVGEDASGGIRVRYLRDFDQSEEIVSADRLPTSTVKQRGPSK